MKTYKEFIENIFESKNSIPVDKGVLHTRDSLSNKVQKFAPETTDDEKWNKVKAIEHLRKGNMLTAKYYLHKIGIKDKI
jgi:hypothetical protein